MTIVRITTIRDEHGVHHTEIVAQATEDAHEKEKAWAKSICDVVSAFVVRNNNDAQGPVEMQGELLPETKRAISEKQN